MLSTSSFAALALAASTAVAAIHIERRVEMSKSYAIAGMRSPTARGWSNDTATESPCGGFPTSSNRTEWPMTGGQISLLITDESYFLELGYSSLANPTTNDDFKPLVNTLSGGDQIGHLCQSGPDMADLNSTVAGQESTPLKIGDELTIQLEYKAGPMGSTSYSQCADIVLVDPASYNSSAMCVSATVSSSSLDGDASSYHCGASSKSGLSRAASGGIGAGITIGVFLLALLALWKAGVLSFNRRSAHKNANSSGVLPGPGGAKNGVHSKAITIDSDASSQGSSLHPAEKKF